ncbi:hypothetical protein K6U06_08210 [Acidiferrimicrobium sp. IK]|uniref:hypothetical protein n=1 Tax=Acidiferrimicrobium sp. IK TaxID=2871700 RepID=UPI0021CB5CEF|nr:hypothetical protein [Acidiferrimicrobium sp. IK]MCU4184342.1 hypothetical protein [Acidiferrimicrobium sp. IK]
MAYESVPAGVEAGTGEESALLQLTCVAAGSGARAVVTVPGDAPAREVASSLGAAVGVAVVGDVLLADGTPIPPDRSLEAAGIAVGATVIVAGIDDDAPASRGGVLRSQLAPGLPAGRPGRAATGARRLPPAAVAAVVGAAAIGFGGGALVFDSGSSPASPGPDPVALRAASAWVSAAGFTGRLAAGVRTSLDRSGALPAGTAVRPVGWWSAGDRRTVVLVVTGPGLGPFSLTAVTVHGALAFPPTAGGLPPAGGLAVPALPARLQPAPDGGSATPAVEAWATQLLGPRGTLTGLTQLGTTAAPQVLGQATTSKGFRVERVAVRLRSDAPGTAEAARLAASAAAATKAKAALAGAQSQAQAAQAAVGAATAKLNADQALAAANPPTPPSAAAAAALPADTAAVANAQTASAGAAAALRAAQQAAAAPVSVEATPATAVATYDLLLAGGGVAGWAPAGSED